MKRIFYSIHIRINYPDNGTSIIAFSEIYVYGINYKCNDNNLNLNLIVAYSITLFILNGKVFRFNLFLRKIFVVCFILFFCTLRIHNA